MHVVTINEHKIAIFWSPKTGHSTMNKILKDYFTPNSPQGWETHTQNIPSNIKDFKFILLYRSPIERLVSSFFMPQMPDNMSFKQFVLNLESYHDHHQSCQASGPGFNCFNQYKKKFDYVINTKDLDKFPIIIEELTKIPIERGIKENAIKRTTKSLEIKYFDMKKSDFKNKKIEIPQWKNFYNDELKQIAMTKLKKDYEFFKSIGIDYEISS